MRLERFLAASLTLLISGVLATLPVQASEHRGTGLGTGPSTDAPTGKKADACREKSQGITKRSEQLADRAAKMQETFGAIAKRVQEYYTSKLQPSGVTINNYDSLAADIDAKKAAANAAVEKAKASATAFSCEANPKERLATYRTDMKATIAALQEYRKSVRNLLVAVRTSNGPRSGGTATSPSPGNGQVPMATPSPDQVTTQ